MARYSRIREAAKETWKNRDKVFGVIKNAGGSGIKRLAAAIAKIRPSLSPRTQVYIGLPIPSELIASRFELLGADPEDLFLQVLVFTIHLPALIALMRSEGLDAGGSLGPLQLKLLDDCSLEVTWLGRESGKKHSHTVPLPPPTTTSNSKDEERATQLEQ